MVFQISTDKMSYTDFPQDFAEKRKLLKADGLLRVYAYKDQIWRIIMSERCFEDNFLHSRLYGVEEEDETFTKFWDQIPIEYDEEENEIDNEENDKFLEEVLAELRANMETYADNMIFLSGDYGKPPLSTKVPKLIFRGTFESGLEVLVMTKMQGVNASDSQLPPSKIMQALVDAYEHARMLYNEYGYAMTDLHTENILIDDNGDFSIIDLELDSQTDYYEFDKYPYLFNQFIKLFPYSFGTSTMLSPRTWEELKVKADEVIAKTKVLEKVIPESFLGIRLKDPLMRLIASFLFQTYLQNEKASVPSAETFVLSIITLLPASTGPHYIRFLQPLTSEKMVDEINQKFRELKIYVIISVNGVTHFGIESDNDEDFNYTWNINGIPIGLVADSRYTRNIPFFYGGRDYLLKAQPLSQ